MTEVREAVVERLLQGMRDNDSANGGLGDFMGAEFSRDEPTDEERAEAHRRYVDELAEKGLPELEPEAEQQQQDQQKQQDEQKSKQQPPSDG